MTPPDGSGERREERASGSVSPRPERKPGSIPSQRGAPILTALTSSYNEFYQSIYGYENTFYHPEALLAYLEPLLITTRKQLETLFVLWNSAQGRSPFEDAH